MYPAQSKCQISLQKSHYPCTLYIQHHVPLSPPLDLGVCWPFPLFEEKVQRGMAHALDCLGWKSQTVNPSMGPNVVALATNKHLPLNHEIISHRARQFWHSCTCLQILKCTVVPHTAIVLGWPQWSHSPGKLHLSVNCKAEDRICPQIRGQQILRSADIILGAAGPALSP